MPVVAVVMVVMVSKFDRAGGSKTKHFFLFVDQTRKKSLKKIDLEYLNFRVLSPLNQCISWFKVFEFSSGYS